MIAIRRVGIELEGGWDRVPPAVADASVAFRPDGSVMVAGAVHSGEIASPPIPSLQVPAWIVANYPNHVGESCGLHVHLSFGDGSDTLDDSSNAWRNVNATALSYLADGAFRRFLRARLARFGKAAPIRNKAFWQRLGNRNTYCRDADTSSYFARGDDGTVSRYAQVNFTAYDRHRTVEIRVLPMFQSCKIAAKAVSAVLDATNEFLQMVVRRPPMEFTIESQTVDVDTPYKADLSAEVDISPITKLQASEF